MCGFTILGPIAQIRGLPSYPEGAGKSYALQKTKAGLHRKAHTATKMRLSIPTFGLFDSEEPPVKHSEFFYLSEL